MSLNDVLRGMIQLGFGAFVKVILSFPMYPVTRIVNAAGASASVNTFPHSFFPYFFSFLSLTNFSDANARWRFCHQHNGSG